MKLTHKDIKFLKSIGYDLADIAQIELAARFCKITHAGNDKRVTHKDFIKSSSKERFLVCLGRAAFHYTASCVLEVGKAFVFDCGKMFEVYGD